MPTTSETDAACPDLAASLLPGAETTPRRVRIARWCAAAFVLAVYATSIAPHWLPGSDSALYKLLGRNLAAGKGYTLFGAPHVHVPPGFPALLAAAEKVGIAAPVAVNAMILALALVAVLAAHAVLREHLPAELALWAAVLFALANHMHDAAMQTLSDVPCILLVAGGLWGLVRWARTGRGWPELAGAALVAACWMRLAVGPLALGAAVGLLLQPVKTSRRRAVANAVGILAALAATAAVFYLSFRWAAAAGANVPSYAHHAAGAEGESIAALIARRAANFYHTGSTLSRLLTSQRIPAFLAGPLIWLPILAGMVVRFRRGQRICVLAAAAYLGALILLRVPRARYLLPVGFLVILYFADGLAAALNLTRPGRRAARYVLPAVLIALIAANCPRDFRRIYHVHHRDFLGVYRGGQARRLHQAARRLRAAVGTHDTFVSSTNTYALALLSGVRALPVAKGIVRGPDAAQTLVSLFDREGVTLVVLHPDQPAAFDAFAIEAAARGRLTPLGRVAGSYRVYRYGPAPTTAPAAQPD